MNDFGSMHYNAIGPWLKTRFGQRMIKLSLDGGFTCPNRDGSKGYGGCSFCSESGSGDFAGAFSTSDADPGCGAASICSQLEAQIKLLSRKWPKAGYLAYFQNHTNTYAPVQKLRRLWDEALSFPDVKGLAIATRPDCLGPEVLQLLSEYNKKCFLWVELGLQSSKETSAEAFNRCYENSVYKNAVKALSDLDIRYVTHLIIGLPGESREDMLASFDYAVSGAGTGSALPFGLKLHMLHLMEGTRMGEEYNEDPWPLPTAEEYVKLLADMLERCPQEITIHRLTGDAPGARLIAPEWTRNKHAVLNALQSEFRRRGSFQGSRLI